LYLHTFDGTGAANSVNLLQFVKSIGLEVGKNVFFVDQYAYQTGLPEDHMAHVYSAMDVLTNVSTGEGFGIPIVEAQACGTPVIVGDWTSMGELCFSGQKLEKLRAAPSYTQLGAYQFIPRFEEVGLAMIQEYEHPSSRNRAVQGSHEYDADKVTQLYWKPVLEDIQANLKQHKLIDPKFVIDTSEAKL
jgi:glycosyltransferase involved in cell wall biosynthesis